MTTNNNNPGRIYLGTVLKGYPGLVAGSALYIERHKWDCGWYWVFGYIGNSRLHCHFDSLLKGDRYTPNRVFCDPAFTEKEWWVIRDLFVQAYALKKCAEVYRYGGHQITKKEATDIIIDAEMTKRLNSDLEKVLDKVWSILCRETKI